MKTPAIVIRVRFNVAGGHTHARMFAGVNGTILGKCGDLCFRNEEFEAFRKAAPGVEFIPDERE